MWWFSVSSNRYLRDETEICLSNIIQVTAQEGKTKYPRNVLSDAVHYLMTLWPKLYQLPPPPNCCQIENILGTSRGGRLGCVPQILVKGTHIQMPPQTTAPNICIIWHILSHFLKKIIARYASSIAFYKISVPDIIEIWACNVKTAQNIAYLLIGLTPKFRPLLSYYI